MATSFLICLRVSLSLSVSGSNSGLSTMAKWLITVYDLKYT